MKKIIIVLGVLLGLFLAAIIVIPLVVNVDQYRPQLVEAINKKINGKMELGQLNLKMWGTIKVGIAGLTLNDAKSRKVISVQSAEVLVPWSSIFGGSPLLTFQMDQPEVRVIKDLNGKLNVMTLIKEDDDNEASENAGVAGESSDKDGDQKLPSYVTNARLGVELTRASFTYSDLMTKGETQANDLNLTIKDLSLSRQTEMKLSGQLAASQEDTFKISGPFVVHMTADPKVASGKLQSMSMAFEGDFGDLDIAAGQAFHKKKGIVAKFDGKLAMTPQYVTISKLVAKFFNAEVSLDGKVTNLGVEGQDPIADIEFKSNSIDLGPWNELIPMLKEYSLSGSASLEGFAKGPTSQLQYGGDLLVKNLKAKSEYLKAEPIVNMSLKVTTDRVEKFLATLTAPGNDLKIEGDVVSFAHPKVTLNINSQSMDLDQLINLPELEKSSDQAPTDGEDGKSAKSAKKVPEEDLDAMLDPLRASPAMNEMVAIANTNIKIIKFYDIAMTGFQSKVSVKNLVASVDQASVNVFTGKITMKASTAMKPKTPTYTFSSAVSGLDLKKAVTSKLELLKNTVIGKLNMKIDGSGASYNTDPAIRNLKAKGSLKVDDAVFTAIDVGKMAGEGINKALEKVGDKIPGLKGKTVKGLDKGNAKYQYVSTDFSIQDGIFTAPNFAAKSYPNTGLDIKGFTSVNLVNEDLKADWEISDPSNMTKARDISVNIAGREISGILANDGKVVVLPISIGCKYTNPCPSYGQLAEHFAKVALDNTKDRAKEVVKEEVKEKATEKAKEVGKKLLKGLFK